MRRSLAMPPWLSGWPAGLRHSAAASRTGFLRRRAHAENALVGRARRGTQTRGERKRGGPLELWHPRLPVPETPQTSRLGPPLEETRCCQWRGSGAPFASCRACQFAKDQIQLRLRRTRSTALRSASRNCGLLPGTAEARRQGHDNRGGAGSASAPRARDVRNRLPRQLPGVSLLLCLTGDVTNEAHNGGCP
jgi:hypothetical protein